MRESYIRFLLFVFCFGALGICMSHEFGWRVGLSAVCFAWIVAPMVPRQ